MKLTVFAYDIMEKFTEFIETDASHSSTIISVSSKPNLEPNDYINPNIIDAVKATMKVCHVAAAPALAFEFWDVAPNKCVADFYYNYARFLVHYFGISKKLSICLINYVGQKKLPATRQDILTSEHINSGVTFRTGDFSKILVYRKEEMPKVLLHEIIHALAVDFHYIPGPAEKQLAYLFCMDSSSLTINETFTDSLTCLINTIMYSLFENRHSPEKFAKSVRANWRKEYGFIKAQCYKILQHHMNYRQAVESKCSIKLKEDTHAIAYYVLKAVILSDLNSYLTFLSKAKTSENFVKLINTRLLKVDLDEFGKAEFTKLTDLKTLRMSSLNIANFICN
jgi:hypothetical protein